MCDCPEAQRWRDYWSDEEVGRRLAEELRPAQDAYAQAIREAISDVRGWRRIYDVPGHYDRADYITIRAAEIAEERARV